MYVFRPLLDIEIYDRLTNDLKLIPSITRIQFYNCYKKSVLDFLFFGNLARNKYKRLSTDHKKSYDGAC